MGEGCMSLYTISSPHDAVLLGWISSYISGGPLLIDDEGGKANLLTSL